MAVDDKSYGTAIDLLSEHAIQTGQVIVLKPWDLIIAAER